MKVSLSNSVSELNTVCVSMPIKDYTNHQQLVVKV